MNHQVRVKTHHQVRVKTHHLDQTMALTMMGVLTLTGLTILLLTVLLKEAMMMTHLLPALQMRPLGSIWKIMPQNLTVSSIS